MSRRNVSQKSSEVFKLSFGTPEHFQWHFFASFGAVVSVIYCFFIRFWIEDSGSNKEINEKGFIFESADLSARAKGIQNLGITAHLPEGL